MRLVLFDTNPALVGAWELHFSDLAEVQVLHGDLDAVLQRKVVDALVSPANSLGYMRGGIDGAYSRAFGPELEQAVRSRIAHAHGGHIPVGQAAVVPVPRRQGGPVVRWMVVAPTMYRPGCNVADTPNVYMAARAAFSAARRSNYLYVLGCPGMGTGVGGVQPEDCARRMRLAWDNAKLHRDAPTYEGMLLELQHGERTV